MSQGLGTTDCRLEERKGDVVTLAAAWGGARLHTSSSCTIKPASQSSLTGHPFFSREDEASQKQDSDTLAYKSNREKSPNQEIKTTLVETTYYNSGGSVWARAVCDLKSTDD